MYPAYPPTPLRRTWRLGQHTTPPSDSHQEERIMQIAQSKTELMDGFFEGEASATPEAVQDDVA